MTQIFAYKKDFCVQKKLKCLHNKNHSSRTHLSISSWRKTELYRRHNLGDSTADTIWKIVVQYGLMSVVGTIWMKINLLIR